MTKLADHELERRYLAEVFNVPAEERARHFAQPSRVASGDFSASAHSRIVSVIHELVHAKQELSPLTVWNELERRGATSAIEVLSQLVREYEPQLDSLNVMSARLVDLARARRIREHHMRGVEAIERLDIEGAQEHARELLGENDRRQVDVMSLHASALIAVQSARKERDTKTQQRIPFGYPLLDAALLGGMRPSTMAIVGGRTSAGKSSLMLGAAIQQASRGIRVGIVSCEDAAEIWGERAIGHFTSQAVDRLLGNQLPMGGTDMLGGALQRLERLGVVLSFALNRPLVDVLASVRALIAEGCKVVYVDYVQAILLGHRGERRDLVREASQKLKAECQQHGVALVLGSQLSRAEKHNRFSEPFESDLKETGDLENMTEVVILLWKTSDADDAKALGKVSKVKWSAHRPRFELRRDSVTGALANLEPHHESNGNGHAQPKPSWT
jgi:Replicative DNA helicase